MSEEMKNIQTKLNNVQFITYDTEKNHNTQVL